MSFHLKTEREAAKLERVLEKREFNSEEELKTFIESLNEATEPFFEPPLTPLEQAQELIYDAWETPSRQHRIKLAKKALELSADCADAYVILAEDEAESAEEALRLYEEGVRAGERALGPETFDQEKGHFWGVVKTRPYMRARTGLAITLWDLGRRQEAIAHLWDLLQLNPGDNQGLRYLLINWLMLAGQDEAVSKLVKRYKEEPRAAWLYPLALWTFRQKGATSVAERRLTLAFLCNPYVVAFLLGAKKMPKYIPDTYTLGSEEEAIAYLSEGAEVWFKTPSSFQWLGKHLPKFILLLSEKVAKLENRPLPK
ncbi:MAG: hypothetical protein QJR13_07310 [Bacillota bacterium]|nr:hypothetical protein [Bacillota bacterium]